MLQESKGTSTGQSSKEMQNVLKGIGAAVQELQSQSAESPSILHRAVNGSSDSVVGVAFAAGSLPGRVWRLPTVTATGWAFGVGLLFGMLL